MCLKENGEMEFNMVKDSIQIKINKQGRENGDLENYSCGYENWENKSINLWNCKMATKSPLNLYKLINITYNYKI